MVIQQVLTPIDKSALKETELADERSIMCYALPAAIMIDGVGVPGGADIDTLDSQFAASVYPPNGTSGPPPKTSWDPEITVSTALGGLA